MIERAASADAFVPSDKDYEVEALGGEAEILDRSKTTPRLILCEIAFETLEVMLFLVFP